MTTPIQPFIKCAKFNIGDVVIHEHQGYRAVIIDIDPLFQASGRYNPQARTRPFASKNPWYRLLVDQTNQQTYVEEPFLIQDEERSELSNPQIEDYLTHKNGHYLRASKTN